jgi:hypothetical protein
MKPSGTLPRAIARLLLASLVGLLFAGMTLWASGALYYSATLASTAKQIVTLSFALLGVAGIVGLFARRLRRLVGAFLIAFVIVLAWWLRITPRNDRDWQPEVAVLPYADINGDLVTVHNIRNFDYRSETDFTPRYYDKTFALRKLDTADLIASYWMGDAIAHMMVSFGFAGQDYLTISIETRKERSESYSTLAGFFKQYELYYVVADPGQRLRAVAGLRARASRYPPAVRRAATALPYQ